MRVLFVTNRNILTTSGELRLIKNRAESLYEEYGITTDFIAWGSTSRINASKREKIYAGGSIDTVGYKKENPLSIIRSYRQLKERIIAALESKKYTAIIYSGSGLSDIRKVIPKDCNVKQYIDIHGSSEDIIELVKNSGFVKRALFTLIYEVDVSALKRNSIYMNGFFVVTKALEQYVRQRFSVSANAHFYKVPCATRSFSVNDHEVLQARAQYRKKYEIKDDEVVFIYSGGVSSWQCIEETVELYKKLTRTLSKKTRFLVFSHNIEYIKGLLGSDNDSNVIFDSYSPEELKNALCAGDYAFMLRKNYVTNNVAFPNKYLEYVQSGMRIIATPYVHEIAGQIKQYNNGYLYDFDSIEQLANYINQNEGRVPCKTINDILEYNSFHKRLDAFAKDLETC